MAKLKIILLIFILINGNDVWMDWLFSKSLLRVCKNILCAMKVKASVFMKQQNNL